MRQKNSTAGLTPKGDRRVIEEVCRLNIGGNLSEEDLAAGLGCRQEDLFSLIVHGEDISHVDHFEGLAEELGLESI